MSIALFHKGLHSLWNSSGLDAFIKNYWIADPECFQSLCDTNAAPGQPFPYVVYEQLAGDIDSRMSQDINTNYMHRDVPLLFHIYAAGSSGNWSSKGVGVLILDELTKVFGGHPTVSPQTVALDSGCVINFQFTRDYHLKEDDDVSHWVVEYMPKIEQSFKVA